MKGAFTLIFAAAAATAVSSVTATAQNIAPLVIHRAEIQAAGWGRLSELVQGLPGWHSYDVQGFDASASPDGLPPAGEAAPGAGEWMVLVDGQVIPTAVIGAHQLDLLPVSIAQVDSVVVESGPVMVGGAASRRGALRIYTRRSGRGAFAQLTYEHGDETGDPGPFRYTALASPNVEKIGPFAHAELGYARQNWDLTLGLHGASLNTTDSAIVERTQGRGPTAIDAVTPTARLRVRALGGEQELLASRGEERGDLFVPNEQLQQSVRSTQTYVGASGAIAAAARTSGQYTLGVSTQRLAELPSGLAFSLEHERRLVRGDASVTRRAVGQWDMTGGVSAEQWRLTRSDTDRSATTERAYFRAVTRHDSTSSAAVTLSLVHAPTLALDAGLGGSGLGLDGQVDARQMIAPGRWIVLGASRVNGFGGEDQDWIDLNVSRVPVQFDDLAAERAFATLEQRILNMTLSAGANVQRADVLLLDGTIPIPVALDTTPGGTPAIRAATAHEITVFGFGGRLSTPDSGRVRGYVEYDHLFSRSDELGTRAEQAIARDQLVGQVAYVPFRDVQLGLGAHLASRTAWWGFLDENGSDPSFVPAVRRVNASVEKWFWKRRLHASYLLENLLDRPDRDHPYGAQWNLRFHVAVGAEFGLPDR